MPWEKSSVRQLYITLLRSFWYWATLEGDIWNIKANQIFYFHPMHLCQCVRWLFSASPGNCSWNRAASLSLVMSNLSQANSEKSYSGPSSEASVFSNSQWPTYDVWLISFTTLCVVFSTYECVFNNSTATQPSLILSKQLSNHSWTDVTRKGININNQRLTAAWWHILSDSLRKRKNKFKKKKKEMQKLKGGQFSWQWFFLFF